MLSDYNLLIIPQKLQELIRRGTPRDLAQAQELMKELSGAVSAHISWPACIDIVYRNPTNNPIMHPKPRPNSKKSSKRRSC